MKAQGMVGYLRDLVLQALRVWIIIGIVGGLAYWLSDAIGVLDTIVVIMTLAIFTLRVALSPLGFIERASELWLAAVGMSLAALESWKPLAIAVVVAEYFAAIWVLGYQGPVWLLAMPLSLWPGLPLLVMASTPLVALVVLLQAEADEFSDDTELARSFGH